MSARRTLIRTNPDGTVVRRATGTMIVNGHYLDFVAVELRGTRVLRRQARSGQWFVAEAV